VSDLVSARAAVGRGSCRQHHRRPSAGRADTRSAPTLAAWSARDFPPSWHGVALGVSGAPRRVSKDMVQQANSRH